MRQALAGARTAIEASDLTLASQRVAEAQGHLGASASLPQAAADTERIRREIEAGQADAARLLQFLKGAAAQHKMSYAAEEGGTAREETRVYGVLRKDRPSRREVPT